MTLVFKAVLVAVSVAIAATGAMAQGVFPSLTSEDLNGKAHSLPAGLPGDPTIVFIAYKQRQQEDVNTWVSALALDPNRGPEFVELPVVGSSAKLMRSVIDNGMRSGIVDEALRARTITIYQNASVVNAPLGFSGRDQIRVLIVKRDGSVLWSTSGPVSVAGIAELQKTFEAAQ